MSKLEPDEQRKQIKNLRLKYHPDKNTILVGISTEITN